MPTADTQRRVADFCRQHGIATISLTPMSGVTTAHRICDLEIEFAGDSNHDAYRAQFKLQGTDSAIGDIMSRIDAAGQLQLTEKYRDATDLYAVVDAFFRGIESRIRKVRQEQSVQNVRFLGNDFILNGTTVFTVVGDDEGRLSIELHKGDERQPAVLLASSVLDGLYDGSIELVESR